MSGPTKAGEPSMDEILASIRKIIAEDPSKAPAETKKAPTFGSAAPLSQTGASPPSNLLPAPAPSPSFGGPAAQQERASPSFGRLSDALRTSFPASSAPPPSSGSFADTRFGQSAPSSPLSASDRGLSLDPPGPVFEPSDRARSIDSELDDILGEPIAEASTAGQRKDVDDKSTSSQWAVWRTPSGKPDAAASPTPAPPAPSAPQPPPSLGRPSGGFYPSSGGFGSSSSNASPSPSAFLGGAKQEPSLPRGEPDQSSFGTLVPKRGDDAAPAGGMPRFEPKLPSAPPDTTPSSGPFTPAAGSAPKKVVIASMPSASPSASAASSEAAPTAASSGGMAPGGTVNVPLPPRTTLFSRPSPLASVELPAEPQPAAAVPTSSTRSPVSAGTLATPPAPVSPPPGQPASTPVSALNALAAGLAASNVQTVASTATEPAAAPTPAVTTDRATPAVAPGVPRSLEDMVADMVKPMLQRWIDDNMPRIIEKALRNEVGQPGGGGKPPSP